MKKGFVLFLGVLTTLFCSAQEKSHGLRINPVSQIEIGFHNIENLIS